MKSLNFSDYLQVFVLSVHFELCDVFSFWVFGVWRNEWYHKSGHSQFIPVRVRIQRARASSFDFARVFELFVFGYFVTHHFAHCRNHFAQLVFKGCTSGHQDRGWWEREREFVAPCQKTKVYIGGGRSQPRVYIEFLCIPYIGLRPRLG